MNTGHTSMQAMQVVQAQSSASEITSPISFGEPLLPPVAGAGCAKPACRTCRLSFWMICWGSSGKPDAVDGLVWYYGELWRALKAAGEVV